MNVRWIVVGLIVLLVSTATVSAGFENWKYYREITITNSGNTLTDYQILIELNQENFDFSKAKSDGSDIRFADSNNNELPYWIEEWSNNKARIWVKVPKISANGETRIYMYYGNPDVVSKSNGDDVFEFFDDFNGDNIDTSKWNLHVNHGSITVENGYLKLSHTGDYYCGLGANIATKNPVVSNVSSFALNYKAMITGNADWGGSLRAYLTKNYNLSREYTDKPYLALGFSDCYYCSGDTCSTEVCSKTGLPSCTGATFTSWVTNDTYFKACRIAGLDKNKWYKAGVVIDASANKMTFYRGDGATIINFTASQLFPVYLELEIGACSSNFVGKVDYVFIRKYASPEPTITISSKKQTFTEIIKNGDFSNGLSDWTFNDTSHGADVCLSWNKVPYAEVAVDNGRARIHTYSAYSEGYLSQKFEDVTRDRLKKLKVDYEINGRCSGIHIKLLNDGNTVFDYFVYDSGGYGLHGAGVSTDVCYEYCGCVCGGGYCADTCNWYNKGTLEVVFEDTIAHIYVNGEHQGDVNITFDEIDEIRLRGQNSCCDGRDNLYAYFDNVSLLVSSNILYQEDFESYSTGSYPSGWKNLFSGKTAYITTEKSYNGIKSFKLEGYPTWARMDYVEFPDLPDRISYEAAIYIADSSNGRRAAVGFMEAFGNMGPMFNAIQFSSNGRILWAGAESVDIGSWQAGKWYVVKAEIDFVNQAANVYINGELKARGVKALPKEFDSSYGHVKLSKFGFTTDNFNGGGTNVIYVDDIKIEEISKEIKPLPELLAYYSFDDGTAKDDSGNNNDGVIHGNPKVVDGVKGKALEFDGVDDYIEVPDSYTLDIIDEITISAWIYLHNTTGDFYLIAKGRDSAENYGILIQNGYVEFNFGVHNYWSRARSNTPVISKDIWHHIAVAYVSGNYSSIEMYVDGQKVPITWWYTTYGSNLRANNYPMIIGMFYRDDLNQYERYFKGIIDELRIYNKALNEIEIKSLYEESKPEIWKYSKIITIKENSGTELEDYQILIKLNRSNFDFSKVKQDGSDIRFFDCNNNELPYWIEEWDYTNKTALIWVKVPYIPANGETKLKMYYGNSRAKSKSNGSAVFEFFDDFENGSLSKWSVQGSPHDYDGSMGIENNTVYEGNYSAWLKCGYGTDCNVHAYMISQTFSILSSKAVISYAYKTVPYNGYRQSWVEINNGTGWKVIREYNSNTWSFFSDITTYTGANVKIRFHTKDDGCPAGGQTVYIDKVFIRKFVSPEPIVSIVEKNQVIIKAENTKIRLNNTETLPIYINTIKPIGSIQLNLKFNSSIVRAINVEEGSAAQQSILEYTINNETGLVIIGAISTAGINNGSLVEIEFEAIEKGFTPVNITVTDITDTKNNPLSYETINGSIEVYKRLKGDANDDGRVTASDALLYLRFAVGQSISPYYLNPVEDDVTCDGRITAADALKVLRKAVGQDLSNDTCSW